jgi:tRNA A-37 threonylcarbamoyl transferase component Bud32
MKTCPQCNLAYPNESAFCFADGATLVTPKDARVGATLAGRYVLEQVLGVGGMATVYRAHHKLVDLPCAVKVLGSQFAQDPTLRERFRREARSAQRLAHPNIIEIYDQGETDDGSAFIAMELLEGTTLGEIIKRGRIPLPRALPIAVEMTRALARAHDFEVIHRDLKPENVFMLQGDRLKLLDFGIARCAQDARITNLGEIFGTPQYMAPERGSSIDAGPPADLYALGVILFQMLTQRLPFEANDPATWLMKHLKETPPRLRQLLPEAPEDLDQLVFEMMAKQPEGRPVDAHRVLDVLGDIAARTGVQLPPEREIPSRASRPPRPADAWQRRGELFERMMGRAFQGGAPPEIARMFEAIRGHIQKIQELRAAALDEQNKLDAIEQEGRDGRLRLGKTMAELTGNVSRTRAEGRALRVQVAPLADASRAFHPQVLASHKEVVLWEGRSGFAEPYLELAAAYRKTADLFERWFDVRRRELDADAEAVKRERVVAEVDGQIKQLRAELAAFDKSVEERRQASQQRLADMGRRADEIEAELLYQAGRLCGPLRSKPELGQLFAELERVRA